MKQKIYATFDNVNDAKMALGNIKKENLNKTHLKVLYLLGDEENIDQEKTNYEFGEELFYQSSKTPHFNWPGVKDITITGLGKIQVATSDSFDENEVIERSLSADELEIIEPEVKAHKIVTIIEAEPELVPKLKLILHTNGAEII